MPTSPVPRPSIPTNITVWPTRELPDRRTSQSSCGRSGTTRFVTSIAVESMPNANGNGSSPSFAQPSHEPKVKCPMNRAGRSRGPPRRCGSCVRRCAEKHCSDKVRAWVAAQQVYASCYRTRAPALLANIRFASESLPRTISALVAPRGFHADPPTADVPKHGALRRPSDPRPASCREARAAFRPHHLVPRRG
jgi:hypothetical protein